MARNKKVDLTFFEDMSDATDSKGYTFLEDYLEENPGDIKIGDTLKVHTIVLTNKKKGYMVRTDKFDFHIWKSNKVTKQLIEALKVWVEQGQGKALYCQIKKLDGRDGLMLGAAKDETVSWYSFGGKYSIYPIAMEELDNTPEIENMFLS